MYVDSYLIFCSLNETIRKVELVDEKGQHISAMIPFFDFFNHIDTKQEKVLQIDWISIYVYISIDCLVNSRGY